MRGRLTADAPLAPFTWFRVGGPAEVLFSPADEDDLAYFLANLPREIPVTVIGLGSNLIVRDGGVRGVVIRLGGKAFGAIETTADCRVIAGAAALDAQVARAAAEAGIDGLAFLRGVPGSIGGALRMNAGAHGGETREVFVEARGIDRAGAKRVFGPAEMGFSYRHSEAPDDVIFTRAVLQGRPGDPQRDQGRDGAHHRRARSLAADSRQDRRLDVQEPAGPQGLAIDRRRRLPRPRRRRRAGFDDALQLPHQPRRRDRRRHRGARRGSAPARRRRRAASSWSGRSSGWGRRGKSHEAPVRYPTSSWPGLSRPSTQ